MSVLRLIAVGFIWFCTALGWMLLGLSVQERTGETQAALNSEVSSLWGGVHTQQAPAVSWFEQREVTEMVTTTKPDGTQVQTPVTKLQDVSVPAAFESSKVDVDLAVDHRQKGLLWFPTYNVGFRADYDVRNASASPRRYQIVFSYPSQNGIYDNFQFLLDGKPVEAIGTPESGIAVPIEIGAHQRAHVHIAYRSRGLESWTYSFGPGVSHVENFALAMRTRFTGFDFPSGGMSPTARTRTGTGEKLDWTFASLVTGHGISISMPTKLNPGPVASRISFFAPVSLLFFFTVLVILCVVKGTSLHPMHYFFLAASFFSFHLLFAYLVDHVPLYPSFITAAITSIALVTTYLSRVVGARFAFLYAGAAQAVYLVMFSYAFFFEGKTGLTITIGAVLTLAVLMHVTARIDWAATFARRAAPHTTAAIRG